jgi:hypothetical protein
MIRRYVMNLLKYGHKVKTIDLRPCVQVRRDLWTKFRIYYYEEYGTYPTKDYTVDDVLDYFSQNDIDVVEQLEVMYRG